MEKTTRRVRRLVASVDELDAAKLEQLARDTGRSISGEIRMAIQEWLRKHGRRP